MLHLGNQHAALSTNANPQSESTKGNGPEGWPADKKRKRYSGIDDFKWTAQQEANQRDGGFHSPYRQYIIEGLEGELNEDDVAQSFHSLDSLADHVCQSNQTGIHDTGDWRDNEEAIT